MAKIYSRVDPALLLHIIHRRADFEAERNDLVEADNFLQCAALKLPELKTFKPHKHNRFGVTNLNYIPQEAWVVITGKVIVTYYDVDDKVLEQHILTPGDCSITLQSGHNYQAIEPCTVYEFKTGPYLNQQQDKTFICPLS